MKVEAGAAARSVRWPALDGLRAVAVTAVICRHLEVLRDGYLGVDVFFTLSGFLITWLLAAERDGTGTVRLRYFWARRALRILPALTVAVAGALVLAVLIAGAGPLGARQAHATVAGLPWVAGFAANWAEASGRAVGMFGQMWSLSVEEQFYLAWPLLLVVVLPRVPRRRLAAGLGVLAACSVGWAVFLTWSGAGAARVYFATDTRGGGLLAGCALALWLSAGPLREARLLRRAAWPAAVGLGVLFAAGSLAPEPAAVAAATAASVVLVAAAVTGSLPRRLERLLCSRAAQATGRRSYGIYLWHFILLSAAAVAAARWVLPAHAGPVLAELVFVGTVGTAVAATFAVAWASWRWVEQPALRLRHRFTRRPEAGPQAQVSPQPAGGSDSAPNPVRSVSMPG